MIGDPQALMQQLQQLLTLQSQRQDETPRLLAEQVAGQRALAEGVQALAAAMEHLAQALERRQ